MQLWRDAYNVMCAKEKQAAAKQIFVFLAHINEQMSDEIGRKARERGFASIDNEYLQGIEYSLTRKTGNFSDNHFIYFNIRRNRIVS